MNRLLYYNVSNSDNTRAGSTRVSGWEIIGKTGTTDEDKDSWFCGLSPYASLAVWTGFDEPQTIYGSGLNVATDSFQTVMSEYLKDKEHKDFDSPGSIIESYYSPGSGLLVESGNSKYVGYYTEDNMPSYGYYSDPNASSSDDEDDEEDDSSSSSGTGDDTETPTEDSGENSTEPATDTGGDSGGENPDSGGDTPTEPPQETEPPSAPEG